jgi:DNA-directed RNA polymerase
MPNEIKIIFSSVVIVILFGIVSSFVIKNKTVATAEETAGSFACSVDTYQCPDGTYVGRVAPYCHFAECP